MFEISLPWIGDGPIGVENVRDIVPALEQGGFEVEVVEPTTAGTETTIKG